MFLAFGIASLILSVVSIFIPGFGVIIAGLSGFLAWMSIGKGLPFGAAAVILNLINIIFLSPGYFVVVGIQASLRNPEQSDLFKIWAIVLFLQIAAVVIFVVNFCLDAFIDHRRKSKGSALTPLKRLSEKRATLLKTEEIQSNLFDKEKNESAGGTVRNIDEIPKAIKVLIHKIHGGRKKDSKFWSPENDLIEKDMESIAVQKPSEYSGSRRIRRPLDIYLYPATLFAILIVFLIIARPDFFPFFKYHNIYNSITTTFPNKDTTPNNKTTSVSQIAEIAQPPKKKDEIVDGQSIKVITSPAPFIPADIHPKENELKIQKFSTAGRVFSWRDQDGKFNFSNTKFPLDNDTLQVQTEINTYHKVTKIKILGNQIFVPVVIGNKGREITLNMLLDTGCSQTTIPFQHLDRVSPSYLGNFTNRLADGSKIQGREAVIDYIKVGSKQLSEVKVTGKNVAGFSNSGLLGLDFLKSHSFKVDFENHYIVWM
jgi:hypothetical protein